MTDSLSILSRTRLLAAAALAAAALSLLAGCKGNTTSAANLPRPVGAPPTVSAHLAIQPAGSLKTADPLSSPLWAAAEWSSLTAPANTPRTTAASKAAILFDSSTLYIAFINIKQPSPDASLRDAVSLYLDTTSEGLGKEMIKVSVDQAGATAATWIRMASAPAPRSDGSPDLGHPIFSIPNTKIAGLTANVRETTLGGVSAWTAVVAIPLASLPTPLVTAASPGTHWKFNLVRTVIADWGTPHAEQLQANLSPIYVGAQEYAPNRLADLVLTQ